MQFVESLLYTEQETNTKRHPQTKHCTMGIFDRKKSDAGNKHKHTKSNSSGEAHAPDVKLTKDDVNHFKVRTASVHDPILSAVQEDQPFQEIGGNPNDPNARKSYLSMLNQGEMDPNEQYLNPDGTINTDAEGAENPRRSYHLTDVFGQPIVTPDISNPTRERDERPLDTIKSFEYAISGDPSWAQNLETQQYGFRVRPDFHLNFQQPQEISYDEEGNPIQQQQSKWYDDRGTRSLRPIKFDTRGQFGKEEKERFVWKKEEGKDQR